MIIDSGLGLVDTLPKELWTEVHNTVIEAVTKPFSKKKKCNKATVSDKTYK